MSQLPARRHLAVLYSRRPRAAANQVRAGEQSTNPRSVLAHTYLHKKSERDGNTTRLTHYDLSRNTHTHTIMTLLYTPITKEFLHIFVFVR